MLSSVPLQKKSINYSKNTGFSLMEILVSLIVLSVGLLGLSGLQIAAIKGTNDAHFRNEASFLLMDTSNRMRSNRQGMNDYLASVTDTTISLSCASEGIANCEGADSNCSAIDLAKYDLNEMACNAQNKLPTGAIELVKIAAPVTDCGVAVGIADAYYSLSFSWIETEQKNVAAATNHKSVALNCFSLRN